MQNSKVNTVLLVVLILLVGVGIWMLSNLRSGGHDYDQSSVTPKGGTQVKDNADGPDYQPQAHPPVEEAATTYTYHDHGFTMELPKGFVPHEEQSEGGPSLSISLPNKSNLSYVTNATFWEENALSSFAYLRTEKIGSTTFKVYAYADGEGGGGDYLFYWFKQGNVGYQFSGDASLLKTFKFVGWTQ
jgi:hypothetical protein